jgi:hypothetical protein
LAGAWVVVVVGAVAAAAVVVVAAPAAVVVVVAAGPRRVEGAHAMACADILSAVYGYTQQTGWEVGGGGGGCGTFFLWSVLVWAADWMVQKLESFAVIWGRKKGRKTERGGKGGSLYAFSLACFGFEAYP